MLNERGDRRAAGCTGVPFGVNPRPSLRAPAKVFLAAVLVAPIALVGCDKPKEQPAAAKLGEPVGVRVDDVKDAAGKNLGNLQGAFALTQGQPPEPLVPEMARMLARIGKNCPAVFAKGSEPMHVRGKVTAGVLNFTATPDESAEQRCFREAMHGQKISPTPLESEIGVELRPESRP
jgi:hypothetical protein